MQFINKNCAAKQTVFNTFFTISSIRFTYIFFHEYSK